MKTLLFLCLALLATLTGCLYKMPTDDCISTLPTMGNPHLTQERPASLIPGKG